MTEQLDRRADTTRLQILLAASHEFARKSYSQVSLDDILAQAEVTKGAMYFHFRSKHELALAIIDHQNLLGYEAMSEVVSRKLSGLETLIDISCLLVGRDIGDDVGRAGLNLLESIGRSDGVQARVLGCAHPARGPVRTIASPARAGRSCAHDRDEGSTRAERELPWP